MLEPSEVTRARTPRGGERPPIRPTLFSCGDCDYATFNWHELQDHYARSGHKGPGLLKRARRISVDLTIGLALIIGGSILLGAGLAVFIWSAKILVLLGIPALLVLVWWIRRS